MVGDTICAQTGTDISVGDWHTFECENGGISGDEITLYMENAGRLSFCGIRAIATIDVMEYQELLSSSDKLDELQKAEYLAGCKVQFLGLYFLCSYEEIKNYKKIPKYYKYFLKNTLKKGFMYGAWTFILDVVYISEEDRADLD